MAAVLLASTDADAREVPGQLLRAARYSVYEAPDVATMQSFLRFSPTPMVAVVILTRARTFTQALSNLFRDDQPLLERRGDSVGHDSALEHVRRHAYILLSDDHASANVIHSRGLNARVVIRSLPMVRTPADCASLLSAVAQASEQLDDRWAVDSPGRMRDR